MAYTVGDLIKQHLSRRHDVNQSRLAAGIHVTNAVITRVCKGQRRASRSLMIRIIDWMQQQAVLETADEANALLAAAGLSGLCPEDAAEAALLRRLSANAGQQIVAPAHSGAFVDWVARCDASIRDGALSELAACLDGPIPPGGEALALFYHGRLAVLRAEYEQGERFFQEAAAAARAQAQTELYHRSLVWVAFCHNLLGNYRLAHTLAERVASILPTDSPAYAEAFLVCGLIAADSGSLQKAYDLLEQARDLALLLSDRLLEARCCANLAPICTSLGRLDRAGHMIQRVEQLVAEGNASPQQLVQVRNTNIYRLRFMGELDEALRIGRSMLEPADDGSRHFRGWLALSTAMAATDADDFDLAERAWEHARQILANIRDNNLSSAELLWERAWLRFRQDRLDEAYTDIQAALGLIEAGMDTEHAHAHAIAAIIDLARDDLAHVSHHFRIASDRFCAASHNVGLASLLLHIAYYHLRGQRPLTARKTLAEALTLLRRYRLCGGYYWHPPTLVPLCRIAIQEDWCDEERTLALHPLDLEETHVPLDRYELDSHPRDVLGEFATRLAARRLAARHWREFAPLLDDPRPRVRRRAAQILLASQDVRALEDLICRLHDDPEPQLRAWLAKHV